MATAQSREQVKNWMQDMRTPSTYGVKWSITRIWMEKQNAHASTSRSPLPMENSSVMQRRYMPTAAMSTLIHTASGTFFLRKMPRIGTMMM